MFLGTPVNKLFILSTPSMRKGFAGEKRIVKIAFNYRQPPERQPTGTPTTLANYLKNDTVCISVQLAARLA